MTAGTVAYIAESAVVTTLQVLQVPWADSPRGKVAPKDGRLGPARPGSMSLFEIKAWEFLVLTPRTPGTAPALLRAGHRAPRTCRLRPVVAGIFW